MNFVSIQDTSKETIDAFDCGSDELNEFIRKYAKQNDKKDIGKTFVCTEDDHIIGYYTLSNAQIMFENTPKELSKGLPKYPIPCIRIARLAIDRRFQNEGYGSSLLKNALLKIVRLSEHTGIYFIIVDAKESSASFYEHYGFIRLNMGNLTYIIPVSTVRKAIVNH
ncbi:MAG: GNAT family N-acetyltransferase [Erysipelotrichaceae bacterium]|nr:GNAT family N-acetyltransferase [Erysipelotrichaceae bacterium]